MERGTETHAGAEHAALGDDPFGAALREYREAIAFLEALRDEPCGEFPRTLARLGE